MIVGPRFGEWLAGKVHLSMVFVFLWKTTTHIESSPGGRPEEPVLQNAFRRQMQSISAAPHQFGGLERRWTPEDLLLGAIASCFTTTFRALSEYSRFEYADLEVEVEGTIRKVESGYSFIGIAMSPKLTIANEEGRELALQLLHKAEQLCLVSRALSVRK